MVETVDRAALAEAVTREANYHRLHMPGGERERALRAAAAELRKTCAGCRHWTSINEAMEPPGCTKYPIATPVDGTGFCHRWEASDA